MPAACQKLPLVGILAFVLLLVTEPQHGSGNTRPTPPGKTDGVGGDLTITNPLKGALFPPEIAPPSFLWKDETQGVKTWLVTVDLYERGEVVRLFTHVPSWKPSKAQWDLIQHHSVDHNARITVRGIQEEGSDAILSSDSISIRTSGDEVGGLIFYREVPLPFKYARTHLDTIRWRLADITREDGARVVLEKLPMCGNCHSFSTDGRTLGMDVDALHDKSSYVITEVKQETAIDLEDIITWSESQGGEPTYGLLSQVSPDGRYAVSTTRDNVFVEDRLGNLAYSQLFFPLKGILQVYDRRTRKFWSLPGADDSTYVHANPMWSPDGSYIVFARSQAIHSEESGFHLSTIFDESKARAFKDRFLGGKRRFCFDLYRIPFNDGKGGTAEPIPGASDNGMSNYFPRYSPDGKWIVFTMAKSFMLLQPDSKLYIMPAEGGSPREMKCNTPHMNSWHSWSPNGKWLVFSSKLRGPYTQLFLTHIDEEGTDTPPVWLENLVEPERAANIPEFVNILPGEMVSILPRFLESEVMAFQKGQSKLVAGDFQGAIADLNKAIQQDPDESRAYFLRGRARSSLGDFPGAIEDYDKAIGLEPDDSNSYLSRGLAKFNAEDFEAAIKDYDQTIKLNPDSFTAHEERGRTKVKLGDLEGALKDIDTCIQIRPTDPVLHLNRGDLKWGLNDLTGAIKDYEKAIQLKPDDYVAHSRKGDAEYRLRNYREAIDSYDKAIELNPASPEEYYKRGMAKIVLGRKEEGCGDLHKANELGPGIASMDIKDYCRDTAVEHKKP